MDKAEMRLLRLAVRRGLMTAADAEDCHFCKQKFGKKYTLEDIVVRRGYLSDDQVQKLAIELEEEIERQKKRRFFRRKSTPHPPAPPPVAPSVKAVPPKLDATEAVTIVVDRQELEAQLREQQKAEESIEATAVLSPEAVLELRRRLHMEPSVSEPEPEEEPTKYTPQILPIGDDKEKPSDEGYPFGSYLVRRPIGRMRMGTVYLAKPSNFHGPPVALQVLDPELAQKPDYVERFQRGAKIASIVDSPNVERFIDEGEVNGQLYQVLPHIDGWTLRERLDSGEPPDLFEALRIARDIASAIAAISDKGLVHRNIKPDNILVLGDGAAILTDLGLAHVLPDGPEDLKQARAGVVGTPGYIAIEQAAGEDIDQRADLYALGATLFEMLVGRPMQGLNEADNTISRNLDGLERAAPPETARLVEKLVAQDPKERFSSAAELLQALDYGMEEPEADWTPQQESAPKRVAIPALSLSVLVCFILLVTVVIRQRVLGSDAPPIGFHAAMVGALGVSFALFLFPTLALVRLGRLPLPTWTQWVVFLKDGVGSFGTALLLVGMIFGPASVINVIICLTATFALSSWLYGILLRRQIAVQRADGGGRILALLSEPDLMKWRRLHVPLVTMLTPLALLRVVVLAYFRT